jgi:hypothetical protein
MPIQSARPVGSLERIIELGRNPAEWGTCSAPKRAESIGCKQWHRCPWKFGKPKNFGVLVAKPTASGDVASIVPMACYDHIAFSSQIKANGGVAKIVAQEGGTIRVRGTKRIHPTGQGHRELTKDDPEATMTIEVFPDPAERKDMAAASYLKELREEMAKQEDDDREAAMIGLPVNRLVAEDAQDVAPEASATDEAGRGKGKRL